MKRRNFLHLINLGTVGFIVYSCSRNDLETNPSSDNYEISDRVLHEFTKRSFYGDFLTSNSGKSSQKLIDFPCNNSALIVKDYNIVEGGYPSNSIFKTEDYIIYVEYHALGILKWNKVFKYPNDGFRIILPYGIRHISDQVQVRSIAPMCTSLNSLIDHYSVTENFKSLNIVEGILKSLEKF